MPAPAARQPGHWYWTRARPGTRPCDQCDRPIAAGDEMAYRRRAEVSVADVVCQACALADPEIRPRRSGRPARDLMAGEDDGGASEQPTTVAPALAGLHGDATEHVSGPHTHSITPQAAPREPTSEEVRRRVEDSALEALQELNAALVAIEPHAQRLVRAVERAKVTSRLAGLDIEHLREVREG